MHSLQGQLLVAKAELVDPSFARSVVLVLEHNAQGALGVILNRPTEMSIVQAWEQVSDQPCHSTGMVHMGGPCEGPLMVIHVHGDHSQINPLPGVHFATDQTDVEWLIEHSAAPIKFFVGYAGWGEGQLEEEIAQGGWDTLPAALEHIFHTQGDLWQTLTDTLLPQQRHSDLPAKLVPKHPSNN